MKGIKSLLAASFVFVAATGAQAASITYNLTGNLVSYTASTPALGALAGVMDYAAPAITGQVQIETFTSPPYQWRLSYDLKPEYFAVDIGAGQATKVYTTMRDLGGGNLKDGGFGYDVATKNLTGTFASRLLQVGAFCIGQTNICSPLHGEIPPTTAAPAGIAEIDWTFDVVTNSFTGTLVSTIYLSSVASIERVYALSGTSSKPFPSELSQIPVPMSGMLFGSAVLALAGAARRSRN